MKKLICIISVIAVLSISFAAIFSVSADVNKYNLGDVDRDGSVTVADVTLLQTYIVGEAELDEEQIKLADVNRDGNNTINDVTYIQSYIAGSIDSFPDESHTEPTQPTEPTTLSVDSEGYYNVVVKP